MDTFYNNAKKQPVMKKLIFTLFIVGLFSGIHAQNDYFWDDGEQISLEPFHKKKFLIVDSTITSESELIETLDNTNLLVDTFAQTKALSSLNVYDSTLTEKTYAIIESQDSIYESELENIPTIQYIGPYYIDNGTVVGISDLFYVRLNNENDIAVLDSMANANNVTILGNDFYMPLFYTLRCSNQSAGNSLEMANLFYESNLFDVAQPSFLDVFEYYLIRDYKSNLFDIFPNPAKNYIYIEKKYFDSNVLGMSIYDLSGKKLKSYPPNSNKISLKGFIEGLYIFKIYLNDKTLTYKILHN